MDAGTLEANADLQPHSLRHNVPVMWSSKSMQRPVSCPTLQSHSRKGSAVMDADEPEQNKLLMLRGAMDLKKSQQLVITYAPFQECSNEEFLMRYGEV